MPPNPASAPETRHDRADRSILEPAEPRARPAPLAGGREVAILTDGSAGGLNLHDRLKRTPPGRPGITIRLINGSEYINGGKC